MPKKKPVRAPKAKVKQEKLREPPTADVRVECYTEYAELMGQRQRTNSAIAAMFARYEGSGIDDVEKKAIKHAYSMESADKKTVARQHKANTQTMIAVGIIQVADVAWAAKAQQAEMPDLTVSRETADLLARARAHSDGYNSGLAGGVIGACPHKPGTETFVVWRDGWTDGAQDRSANPNKANEKAADTRRARGKGDDAAPGAPDAATAAALAATPIDMGAPVGSA